MARTTPKPPDWLTDEAKALWPDVCKRVGECVPIDPHAIGRYLTIFIQWRKASEFIDKYGATYPIKDAKENVTKFLAHPQIDVLTKLSAELSSLEKQLRLAHT